MGQATSAQQAPNAQYRAKELSSAQITDNINNLFRSPNTTMLDSVKITRDGDDLMDTSSINVSTIVQGMRGGGNRSKLSIIPRRQRYKVTKKRQTFMSGGGHDGSHDGENDQLASEDVRYVRNMIYQRQRGGSEVIAPPTVPVGEPGPGNTAEPGPGDIMFSPTSDAQFTDTDDNAISDVNLDGPSDSAPDVSGPVVATAPAMPVPPAQPLPQMYPPVRAPATRPQQGGNNLSIESDILTIRRLINNTLKQRGGDGDHVNDPADVPSIPSFPVPPAATAPLAQPQAPRTGLDDSNPDDAVDVLSDEGLFTIRQNLAKYGFSGQQGGMMDNDLEIFKNTILSQDGEKRNDDFYATSPNPVNYAQLMRGGDGHEEEEEDDNDDDNEEFPDDDDDDDDDDEDLETEEEEEDDGDSDPEMKGGTYKRYITDDDSSSVSDSSSSGSSDSSDDSSSDMTDSSIIIMHNSIDKAMDRKRNRSKYLRSNYTITSNSERNYKINNKPLYSSQSSEYQSNHGSEYLNNLRNRDRLK